MSHPEGYPSQRAIHDWNSSITLDISDECLQQRMRTRIKSSLCLLSTIFTPSSVLIVPAFCTNLEYPPVQATTSTTNTSPATSRQQQALGENRYQERSAGSSGYSDCASFTSTSSDDGSCPPPNDDNKPDMDTGNSGDSDATCATDKMKDELANKEAPSASDTSETGSSRSSGNIDSASNGDVEIRDAQATAAAAVPERYLIGCNQDEAEAGRR